MSAYAARAQQKLQQAVRTNSTCSAFEFVQHFVSLTAVLLCCYSKPCERAALCFVPLAVCSCLRTPRIPCVYCRVRCTCHNNIYPDPPDRKYTQLWDIMYHIIPVPLNCIHTHMHVKSSPGEAHHSFFCETCPPFASFVGLPFPVFIGLPGFPAS